MILVTTLGASGDVPSIISKVMVTNRWTVKGTRNTNILRITVLNLFVISKYINLIHISLKEYINKYTRALMYCNDILILQNGYFGVHTVFYTKLTI